MNKIKSIIITSAALLLGLLPGNAQNIIRPKISGPNDTWVNSYNGVLFFGRTDMETRNSVMPMQLRFYYNSSANETDYGYGLGFSLGYEMRYDEDSEGNVTIETGDGRTDTFTRYGKEYQAPAGVFSVLTKDEKGYVLTEKTGEKYVFTDTLYRHVTGIADRYDNQTTLTYQDSLLVRIADAANHVIDLNYTDGLLTTAKASFQQGSYSYDYDASRRLKKITDPMGYTTLYGYTRDNRLNEITDANGYKTIIGYNNSGMVSRLKTDVSDKSIRYEGDKTVFIDYTYPGNQYSYYRWDEKGRVIEKVGLCCGTQSKLEYDLNDNVIRMIDGNGNATDYTYDKNGNMLSLTDALGNSKSFTYEPDLNQAKTYTDKNGNLYRFSYNGKGSLTDISGSLGSSKRYTYNEKGWQLTETDANNNVAVTTYNEDGTISTITDAAGNKKSFTYDSYGNILTATDARGNITTYAYDKNNQIISQTDPLGNTTTVSYDKVGNIVRVKDAKGHITAYSYDAVGNILTQTDAMGGITRYEYDGKGNVLTVVNPLGQTTRMTYNDRNKLLSQTNPAGETTSFDYDVNGNMIAALLPNGNIISYDYGPTGLLDAVDDNIGIIVEYTYDANGNRLTETDGLNRTVTYTYDALNRKVSETLPSGSRTTYAYDANSNLLSITDALGNITQYTYSALNQQLSHIDALNAKTTFEYDGNGNLIKATDARGNATVWTYDPLNRNTFITFANGKSLQYSYDEVGNITGSKDRAGNAYTYAYDALGRLLSKTYADGSADSYTYDAIGRLLSAINKDATVRFVYDGAGRLTSESLNGKITSYSYDIAGGKRTLTYPSGMKVEERLNARDMITNILQNGNEVVTMSYNVAGQKTAQTYANGITTNYGYNNNGWLEQIADASSILNLKMSYDAIGNITKREDLNDAAQTENYTYDAIAQLTGFTRGNTVNTQYAFDLLGNRTKVLENNVATNYTANNVNAYTAISGGISFTPQYDGNGNLLNDDKHSFAYDLNNRLKSVDVNVGTYTYDALGRRISKTTSTSSINYYYVGDQMVEEYNGKSLNASCLYGNNIDETLQMKKGNNVYYYHTNNLGSTMALTDSKGALVERVSYDVYGKPSFFNASGDEITESSIGNNILFTGREYDSEAEIYFFRARSQHPTLGRFMQKDPLIYVDRMNDLTYCMNSTLKFKDPHGLHSYGIGPVSGIGNYMGNPFTQAGQGIEKAAEREIPKICLDSFEKGAYKAAEEAAAKAVLKTGEEAALKAAGEATAKMGGKVLGGIAGGLIDLNNGYNDYRNGNNPYLGFINAVWTGAIAGAATGAALGVAVGGVGAAPGAVAGARSGAISGAVNYVVGYNFAKYF